MTAEVIQITESKKQIKHMNQVFEEQKAAFRKNPMPSCQERIANLKKLRDALMDNQQAIIDAISQDFSCRSTEETKLAELMTSVHGIDYTIKNLKSWMAIDKKKVSPLFQPATSFVQYQPLGVIGIISPWNYTVALSMGPLIAALAAGNRAMIKMSEFTPATSESFKQMIAEIFTEDHVAVVTGGADVASKFTQLPFNHILFTGSTSVGKHVMRAAAENLTPVTLELGGKSPVLIHESFPTNQVAERIASCKVLNAGQTCIAPDYVLCQKNKIEDLIDDLRLVVSEAFPTMRDNDEYTAIVNERQFLRLKKVLRDAEDKGASIIPINPANEDFTDNPTQKIPPTLIINPDDDALCMQDEIFGPLLPIKSYKNFEETINYINEKPRPLAAYYFGKDKIEEKRFLTGTTSGGVSINDVMFHMLQKDLPFGGVGPSGMGAYHGIEGFKTFSHAKGVYRQPKRIPVAKLAGFMPPYGPASEKNIKQKVKR